MSSTTTKRRPSPSTPAASEGARRDLPLHSGEAPPVPALPDLAGQLAKVREILTVHMTDALERIDTAYAGAVSEPMTAEEGLELENNLHLALAALFAAEAIVAHLAKPSAPEAA